MAEEKIYLTGKDLTIDQVRKIAFFRNRGRN